MAIAPIAQELGPYWLGDEPSTAVEVEFVDDYGEVTDPPEGVLTASLHRPGEAGLGLALPVLRDSDSPVVEVEFDDSGAVFDTAGVWSIEVREAGGPRLAPIRFVIESPDGWLTLSAARADWADAPASDVTLYRVLNTARTLCLEFAPALAEGAPIPDNYVQAQLEQARAVWNSSQANDDGQVGADGLAVRVYVRSYNVEALLRPKRGRKVIR